MNCVWIAPFRRPWASRRVMLIRGMMFPPLLEEERHLGSGLLVAQATCPVWMHRARARAALAFADHPVDLGRDADGIADHAGNLLLFKNASPAMGILNMGQVDRPQQRSA